jgi:hypothetical protein
MKPSDEQIAWQVVLFSVFKLGKMPDLPPLVFLDIIDKK